MKVTLKPDWQEALKDVVLKMCRVHINDNQARRILEVISQDCSNCKHGIQSELYPRHIFCNNPTVPIKDSVNEKTHLCRLHESK